VQQAHNRKLALHIRKLALHIRKLAHQLLPLHRSYHKHWWSSWRTISPKVRRT
jgi:hypothetical protein